MNGGGLSYQKRPGDGRTLSVILHTKLGVDMVLGCSRAGERCKNDAVREGESTDSKRGEESRRHLSGVE
jgi:hypothetical protein